MTDDEKRVRMVAIEFETHHHAKTGEGQGE